MNYKEPNISNHIFSVKPTKLNPTKQFYQTTYTENESKVKSKLELSLAHFRPSLFIKIITNTRVFPRNNQSILINLSISILFISLRLYATLCVLVSFEGISKPTLLSTQSKSDLKWLKYDQKRNVITSHGI